MHITIYPDEQWKSADLVRRADLNQRRIQALAQDDQEAATLISGWRNEGKSDQEIEVLLANSPIDFDPTLETSPLDIGGVTFDEWHLTDQSGSAWFSVNGQLKSSDSQMALQYARQYPNYFASLGLAVV